MSTWADAMAGLQERLETVPGLALVIAGEPSSMPVDADDVPITPLAYYLYAGTDGLPNLPKRGEKVIAMIRVLVRWQDNANSEAELAPFVESIPAAFDPRPHLVDAGGHPLATLGGRVGMAQLQSAESGETAGFYTIADVPYRAITWRLAITRKGA